ncbi:MAG: hypothetical protein ACJ8AK_03105 [Gemmatimonadaceae bacterium]
MKQVTIPGGTADPFWPVRVEVEKDGDLIPFEYWFWYRWQGWTVPDSEAATALDQADGSP